jgi:hypothetical protein
MDGHLELVKRYRDVGVTALSVGCRAASIREFSDRTKQFADEVILRTAAS